MDVYDIVLKSLLDKCRDTLLEYFLGLDLEDVEIMEIHQETTSVRRADFPLKVRTSSLGTFIVLLELQTKWDKQVPLRLLEYDVRYRLKTGMKVLPVVMVLTESPGIVDYYEGENIQYRFRVIRFWEMDAREVIEGGYVCLAPLTVLMKDGKELHEKADRLIVESKFDRETKGTLLTAMTLLSGLVDKHLPRILLERRQDMMRESFAYNLIKEEGLKEGLEQGLQQGLQKGLQQGLQQGLEQGLQKGLQQGLQQGLERGMLEDAREMVLEALTERFKMVPKDVEDAIRSIQSRMQLKELLRAAISSENLQEFRKLLDKATKET